MSELRPGAHDRLVTRALREAIESLPANLTAYVRRLEHADAVEYLARELAERARRHLQAAAEDQSRPFLGLANRFLDQVETIP